MEDARFCAAVRGWLQRYRHVRRLAVTSGPLRARLFHLMGGSEDGVGGAADSGTRLVTYSYSLPFIAPHEIGIYVDTWFILFIGMYLHTTPRHTSQTPNNKQSTPLARGTAAPL